MCLNVTLFASCKLWYVDHANCDRAKIWQRVQIVTVLTLLAWAEEKAARARWTLDRIMIMSIGMASFVAWIWMMIMSEATLHSLHESVDPDPKN